MFQSFNDGRIWQGMNPVPNLHEHQSVDFSPSSLVAGGRYYPTVNPWLRCTAEA